jgi:endogenous inhibitor of DNA gyrase (YacG/DUF329 family)
MIGEYLQRECPTCGETFTLYDDTRETPECYRCERLARR